MTHSNAAVDLDRIVRSIDIDADIDAVFELISRPGWWINAGAIESEPRMRMEDGVAVLIQDQWGTFRVQPLSATAPHVATMRWLDRDDPSVGTTVEFRLTTRAGADEAPGVTVQVAESGFAQLGNTAEQAARHRDENGRGWESQLEAARLYLTDEDTDEDADA